MTYLFSSFFTFMSAAETQMSGRENGGRSQSNSTDEAKAQKQLPAVNPFKSTEKNIDAAGQELPELKPFQLKKEGPGSISSQPPDVSKQGNGLPKDLQAGIKKISGVDLADVSVQYNSPQPAQFKAHAYAQGTNIHISQGQEQHLAHEAWHVVQQKQGRVQATTQLKGAGINDDIALEAEADQMGAKAMNVSADQLSSGFEKYNREPIGNTRARSSLASTAQLRILDDINNEVSTTVQKRAIMQLVEGKFLVEDGKPLQDGQVNKSTFLSSLREGVKSIAKEILEPAGLAQSDCPDLNYWINYYQGKSAAYFEASIEKYAPATTGAKDVSEYMEHLVQRVKAGLENHVANGSHEVEPETAPEALDEKRPDPSILAIQKKTVAPIQFGLCASSTATTEPATTEEKEEFKNTGEQFTVEQIKRRAGELKQLHDAKDHMAMAKKLYEWEKQTPPQRGKKINMTAEIYPTLESYLNYLDGCSAAASAIATYVIGHDIEPKLRNEEKKFFQVVAKPKPGEAVDPDKKVDSRHEKPIEMPGFEDHLMPLLSVDLPDEKSAEAPPKSGAPVTGPSGAAASARPEGTPALALEDVKPVVDMSDTKSPEDGVRKEGEAISTGSMDTGPAGPPSGSSMAPPLATATPPPRAPVPEVKKDYAAFLDKARKGDLPDDEIYNMGVPGDMSRDQRKEISRMRVKINKKRLDKIPFKASPQLKNLFSAGDGYFYIRFEGGQLHHFTIISIGGIFQLYESDDIPVPAINFIKELAAGDAKSDNAKGLTGPATTPEEITKKIYEVIWRSKPAGIMQKDFFESLTVVRYKSLR